MAGAIHKLNKNINRPRLVSTGVDFMGLPIFIGINHPNQAGVGEAFRRFFMVTLSRAKQYSMCDFIKQQQRVLENLDKLETIVN